MPAKSKSRKSSRKRKQSGNWVKGYSRKDYGGLADIDPAGNATVRLVRRGQPNNIGLLGQDFKSATEDQRAVRRRYLYTGKGGYFGRMLGNLIGQGDAGDRIGDAASTAISGMHPYGALAMRGVGSLGNLLSTGVATGNGDYSTNSLVDPTPGDVPQFSSNPDGSVIYTHKEYLQDLAAPASVKFSPTVYQINPGLIQTFPWLSQMAANFEEYTLHQCILTFKSTVADFASASGQVGQVIMATQYNSELPDFVDKRGMMEYTGSQSAKTSALMLHGIECDPRINSGSAGKFVRTGPLSSGDINTYDQGKTTIAIVDVPSTYYNQIMGELWVSYTVELRKPKQWTSKGNSEVIDKIVCLRGQQQVSPYDSIFLPLPGDLPKVHAVRSNLSGVFYPTGFINGSGQLVKATTGPPPNTGYGVYVFHPSIEGIFSVKLHCAVKGIQSSVLAGNFAPSPTFLFSGNVVPFSDMLHKTNLNFLAVNPLPTRALADWKNGETGQYLLASVVPPNTTTGTDYEFNVEWHVRVSRQDSGVVNALVFQGYPNILIPGLSKPVLGPYAGAWDLAELTIEQYNSYLSYNQGGVNDAVIYENEAGTIVDLI